MFNTSIPVLLVGMYNHLRVTIGAKMMTTFLKPLLKLTIVIDFSVEDDHDALILVEHGLMATSKVNNRKTAYTQGDTIAYPDSLVVWSTMAYDPTHVLYEPLCVVATTFSVDKTSYSTHRQPNPFANKNLL